MSIHRLLIMAVILATSAPALAGDALSFTRYTGYDDPAVVPGSGFSVTMNANQAQGWVDFTFAMDLAQGVGTITRIWFEQGAEGLRTNTSIVDAQGQIDMRFNTGSSNPAGASGELDWNGTHKRLANRGSVANGIDAGESLTIRFLAYESFFTTGLDRFLTGEARIAFHLQRIGPGAQQSVHYVSTGGGSSESEVIPLPSPALLAALVLSGGLGVARPRRR
jgi:hypothetical protein